jgi:hypothetical protein
VGLQTHINASRVNTSWRLPTRLLSLISDIIKSTRQPSTRRLLEEGWNYFGFHRL